MKHVLLVSGAEAGCSLAGFLAARLALEASEAEAWVRGGAVYLDGTRQRQPAVRVRPGQQVIARSPGKPSTPLGLPLQGRLVYRDDELAVLDKPAGLASLPLRQGGTSLHDQLPGLLGPEARLLHRLDREASGLLLCSVSPGARRALGRAVAEHRLGRRYLAVVVGELGQREVVIRSRLSVHNGRTRSSQDPRASQAVTRIRTLCRLEGRTLLEAALETGRTHQIRVHLAEAGLPILGDARYGGAPAPRLALHAYRLEVVSPSGRWLDLHSPLPAELHALLDG